MIMPLEKLAQTLADCQGRGQSTMSTLGDLMLAMRHEMLEATAVPGSKMGLSADQRAELVDAIYAHCLRGMHHHR